MNDFLTVVIFILKSIFKGGVIATTRMSRLFIGTAHEAAMSNGFAPKGASKLQSSAKTGAVGLPGSVVMLQKGEFDVADRIVSIQLKPSVGVINMRLYMHKKRVERDLIIHEPELKRLLGGRLHKLENVSFSSFDEIENLRESAIEHATQYINTKGRPKAIARASKRLTNASAEPVEKARTMGRPQVVAPTASTPSATPAAPTVAADPLTQTSRPTTFSAPNHPRPKTPEKVFKPVAKSGITYVGRLTSAGHRTQHRRDQTPYEVFEAVLMLDNGAELPLRGAELERELHAQGIKPGERVSITPTGKVPVTLANGAEGSKNLYRVECLESHA